MIKHGKRENLSRGKGHLSAAGPQGRFILFLFLLLVAYTFLLKIFQKLAAIVDVVIFVPVALVTLLLFIGIAGAIYSHRFMGPLARINRVLGHVAEGDCSVSLRLREADDPVLKDLARTIADLCERGRNTHARVREAAQDLSRDLTALDERVRAGAPAAEIHKLTAALREKQAQLEQAVSTLGG